MNETFLVDFDSDDIIEQFLMQHFHNVAVPEDVRDGDARLMPTNPQEDLLSSIAVYGKSTRIKQLPTPTWSLEVGEESLYCYTLSKPTSTKDTERINHETGEVTVGRSKSYNLALQIEHNLTRLTRGRTPETIPNPIAGLDVGLWEFLWSGEEFTLKALEIEIRSLLSQAKMRWDSLHPKFLADGGHAMSDSQQEARVKSLAKGPAARHEKALKKARVALSLHTAGTKAALEEYLGLSGTPLNKYLSHARKMVREADEAVDQEMEN